MGKRGNLEGSIYQRKSDGLWLAEMQTGIRDGRPAKRYFSGKTRAVVSEKLKRALAQQQDGTLSNAKSTRVGKYLTDWLASTGVKQNTRKGYETAVRLHLTPHLGTIKLEALTALHVKQATLELAKEGRTHATIRYAVKVLRKALNDAMRDDILHRNVAEKVRVEAPTDTAPKKSKAWTPEDLKRFLAAPYVRLSPSYPVWYVALASGLRRGELLGLKWSDINFTTGLVHITRQALEFGKSVTLEDLKTETSVRHLVLTQSTLDVLREQQHRVRVTKAKASHWTDLDLVFPNSDGTPRSPNSLTKAFSRAVKATDSPTISLHGTRHTTASVLKRLTNDSKLVSTVLGHTDQTFTDETYVHLSVADLQRAALDLNRLETGN